MGLSTIDQIAKIGLSSLQVFYYFEKLFMKHESYLAFCLRFQLYTKTGNSQFFKVLYQLKLRLIHIKLT
ncbi:hypothetical protein CKY12_19105 [Photorhabdus sp. S12-55]|nr:hypothetical protein PluDJC_09875 [Photorhabdus laumondii subsp. laumondii]RAW69535.1 hypothetical protein CKY15_13570 [Photorhabdus sp. S7-51]RAW70839.1 hypothetical protein CKY14_13390 [Photorhabdus sp. S14-60]RAW77103.1 hypothetical protein CKY06_13675 [Photorhabdus sp. S15-56]RAW81580.1 hypothetical protein CKY12_19105 [Photorhabdus sp. S12-55]RAW81664.1 hypothetical protein CKY09_18580 [Photorhabdus sp. S5P8-50]